MGFRPASTLGLTAFCRAHHAEPARFLTVDRVYSKAGMAGWFAGQPTVVEMESTAVAAAAHARGVAFLGLRAISDEATQEIAWQPDSILDDDGRVSVPRVVGALARRPGLMASLPRLWRDSRVAGRELATALAALLQLAEEDLRTLTEELRLVPLLEAAELRPGSTEAVPGSRPAPSRRS